MSDSGIPAGGGYEDRDAAIAAILAACEPGDVVTIHEETCPVLLAMDCGDDANENDLEDCDCPVIVTSEHRA